METVVTRNFALELGERKTSGAFPAVLSTEAPVERSSFEHGRFLEVLSHQPGAIDLGRAPLPLIVSHDSRALPLGVIENVRVENRKLRGDVRFSSSEAGKQLQADVDAGIVRSLSVAYRILEHQKTKAKETLTITATRWEPYEASAVSIPADRDAGFFRGIMEHEQITHIPNTTQTDERTIQERERVSGIMLSCRTAKLADEFATGLIDSGKSLEAARADILQELFKRDAESPGPRGVVIESSAGDTSRGARMVKDVIDGRMGALELARSVLSGRGERAPSNNQELITRVMTTSDFPAVLTGAVGASLRRGYETEPASHRLWVRKEPVKDFRTQERPILGSAPDLKKKVEAAEYEWGAFDDDGATFVIATYGRIVGLTRETLVNDRLNAFLRVLPAMGQAAARLEADLVYDLFGLNSNTGPTMQDGVVLFHANHANVTSAGAFDADLLSAGRLLLRRQTAVGGGYLALQPTALIVRPEEEHDAELLLAAASRVVSSSLEANVSEWIKSLTLVVEPRLTHAAAYLVADTNQIDSCVLALLESEQTPFFETRSNFETDNVDYKVRHSTGAAFLDWRGIVKMPISG